MRNGPEAPVFFVDDSVPASGSARIDSENFHVGRLRSHPDSARLPASEFRADFADDGATLVPMFRGSFFAFAALAALVVAPRAGATSVEHVRVAGPGVTAAFPRGISLELASPPAYKRRSADLTRGAWGGPAYWASRDQSKRGTTSIKWSVDFQARPGSAKAIAVAAPQHGWPLDKKDPIAVPHYVGKRVVGTILGFYAITRAPAPNDASYEAALAFAVGPRAFTIVRFELSDPAGDSSGQFGDYLVNGLDLPSIWNRGQAFWALSGVKLLGNLPPTRIALSDSGRTLRGTVTDAFYHPVLGLPVSIQRQVGGSWRPLATARTDKKGEFSLRVPARGSYRAVAKSNSRRVLSRALFVG
jgi:hypothetical protein